METMIETRREARREARIEAIREARREAITEARRETRREDRMEDMREASCGGEVGNSWLEMPRKTSPLSRDGTGPGPSMQWGQCDYSTVRL